MKRIGIVVWALLLGILVTVGTATAGQNGKGTFTGQQALTDSEKDYLIFLREEEKLARDVYLYLLKVWELRIFENIAASEQRHMDAVENLLIKYDLKDPAAEKGEGEFTNPDLQKLYESLIYDGSLSKLEALQVGVDIEEMDIDDLQEIISETHKLDIIKVCSTLMDGSINHLEAFSGKIELMGETYNTP
jgi:hypothetical protein